MTCFVAHMRKKGYFNEVRIEVTKDNARAVEDCIARIVGMEGKDCPEIWNTTKIWLADPKKKEKLDSGLREEFSAPGRR